MELATGEDFEGVERLIYNAIKKKGDTAIVKIYNTDRRKAPACEEFWPDDDGPLDAAETVKEIAEYIDQEADSHEKFIVAIKRNGQESGTKYTIKGRKKRASLGSNNNTNGMGMNQSFGIVGHLLNQNQQLQTNSMQTKSEVMQLIAKISEDNIRREANADINYYKSQADKEKKKRKKAKKKKNKKPSLLREIATSESAKDLAAMAMENIFGPKNETKIIPIKPLEEQQRTTVHADVAGTESTSTRNTNTPEEEDEADELTDGELEALEGYDYLLRNQEPDAGLTVHAMCRMLIKQKNHFAAKSIRKMIDKEKAIILSEKGG